MSKYREAMDAPEYSAPMNLPQRMLFQQHKNDTGGVSRGGPRVALSSAMTLSAALMPTMIQGRTSGGVAGLSAVSTVALRVPERVPTYSEAQAASARGAQAFPQPQRTLALPGAPVRTRPFRQPNMPPFEAFGDSLAEHRSMEAADEAMRATNAMRSVALTKSRIRTILGR